MHQEFPSRPKEHRPAPSVRLPNRPRLLRKGVYRTEKWGLEHEEWASIRIPKASVAPKPTLYAENQRLDGPGTPL